MDEIEEMAAAIAPVIKAHVERATAPLQARIAELEARKMPAPVPGETGPKGPQGAPGETGPQGPAGEPGADGKDGRDGRDGLPGVQGEKGIDGTNGRDGTDGLGFGDLKAIFDGERTITLIAVQGEKVNHLGDFIFPILLDRGVFKSDSAYTRGDVVSFGGSLWIAQRDTKDKPETSDAWRLSVKRGRDGKDGKNGERGPEGRAGRDLTPAYR